MGILARQLGEQFVITSDRTPGSARTTRAPQRLNDNYQVWTGADWSVSKEEAIGFASPERADEYIRMNLAKLTA